MNILCKLTLILVLIYAFSCKSKNRERQTLAIAIGTEYKTDEQTIQKGMTVFNKLCAGCHNFSESVIGPNLAGITSEVSKDWLLSFIKNPQNKIESGDQRAMESYAKYKVYMPSFETINDNELDDLLGFIHKFSEAEKRSQKNRAGGILNPIPEKIPQSNLTLAVEEFLTVPSSSQTIPKARINKFTALKTKNGSRLFIADLRGKLYEIRNAKAQVYLNLNDELENFVDNPGWGTGLGSFDFHPEFEENGLFYTTHTEPSRTALADFSIPDSIQTKIQWVLTEWKTNTPAELEFDGQKREILRMDMISSAHGFQELTFNPLAKKESDDYGLLYLCVGDGSAALAGYPFLCNNPNKPWGSVFRINPAGSNSKNGKYGIPKDNAFVNEKNKLDEIWAYGFRNPHRISWDDSGSGNVLVTNIGQHSVEEVNLLKKGANYGWPFREGTFLYDTEANTEIVYPLPADDNGFTYPVIQFDHDEANAVSGGFVYSGAKIPLLKNKYLFGDITHGKLFYSNVSEIIDGKQAPVFKIELEVNGEATSFSELAKGQRVDLRFGKDLEGELYLFTKSDGKVYKIVDCKSTVSS